MRGGFGIEEHVEHWATLPMDEAQLMDSLNSQDNLRDVEAGDVFREDLVLNEHGHKIASWQELHQHVQEILVLEGSIEFNDPGAVGLSQDITLGANMSQLVLLEHLTLD
jgi:hypothetical protein